MVCSGGRVLAGSAQEEEGNAEHVDDCKGLSCAMLACDVGSVIDYADWHRLDSVRRRVCFGVASELAAKAKLRGSASRQPRVFGPHACKGLSHRTEGAFHRARLDRPATGGKLACSIAVGKDL